MIVGCDIAEFQPVVGDTYPHRWLTWRACFGGSYPDKHAPANLAWCASAVKSGRLDGYGCYVVYLPGQNAGILDTLDRLNVPTGIPVMVDVEAWHGESYAISGDHSADINALCVSLSQRQGDQEFVWGYANRPDYGTIWPIRPSWLGLVVASYGGTQPVSPGPGPLVGWQYTDGTWTVPGLPSSSAPFGACDHNAYYQLPEADMPTADEIAAAVWSHPLTLPQAAPLKPVTAAASAFQVNASDYAHDAKYGVAALVSQIGALKATLATIAANQNATQAELVAAAEQGAAQALAGYQLTLSKGA